MRSGALVALLLAAGCGNGVDGKPIPPPTTPAPAPEPAPPPPPPPPKPIPAPKPTPPPDPFASPGAAFDQEFWNELLLGAYANTEGGLASLRLPIREPDLLEEFPHTLWLHTSLNREERVLAEELLRHAAQVLTGSRWRGKVDIATRRYGRDGTLTIRYDDPAPPGGGCGGASVGSRSVSISVEDCEHSDRLYRFRVIILHELGHYFGLFHLNPDRWAGERHSMSFRDRGTTAFSAAEAFHARRAYAEANLPR